MLMSIIWLSMMAAAIIFASATGSAAALSKALFDGAQGAVDLGISITGAICLWSGLMEVMTQSGLAQSLSRILRPFLSRLFPHAFSDNACAEAISANFTANLLGLGNAATPAGLKAVGRMKNTPACRNELSRFTVLNSASLQLIPSTLAAIRSSLGSQVPLDILPCVWITSIAALSAGLIFSKIMEGKSP